MKTSLRELDGVTRDQVVMVRVDEQTSRTLDAWVETGAVRSRSEAAALFIREGLKVRAEELERLRDALREVEDAKRRLREKARGVLGDDRPE
jgi:Arc/MetJ-type ribon-helix-helix transcriptional regulator